MHRYYSHACGIAHIYFSIISFMIICAIIQFSFQPEESAFTNQKTVDNRRSTWIVIDYKPIVWYRKASMISFFPLFILQSNRRAIPTPIVSIMGIFHECLVYICVGEKFSF